MDEKSLKELKNKLSEFKKDPNQVKRSRSSKIGILFDEIDHFISISPNPSIEILNSNLPNLNDDPRENVISKILNYFQRINSLSEKIPNAKFISIPLYDMKIIGKLLNLLIIHGIYEIIPIKYLIPLENRRLKDFRMINKLNYVPLNENIQILEEILQTFNNIFKSNSDLKDLILIGVGLTDMLNICLVLYLTTTTTTTKLENKKSKYLENLSNLESLSSTYQLLSFYTLLLNYSNDSKLKLFLRGEKLPELLMKSNGVESLIDLILGLRENEEIDVNRIKNISMILLNSKPSSIPEQIYFKCICDQIFNSLVFVNRPIMVTIIVQLILLILNSGNSFIIKEYIFKRIWKSFNPLINDNDEIVLTSGIELNNSFNVILSIVRCLKQSDQEILLNLLQPIIPQLWWFANYQRQKGKDFDIILNMLKNSILLDSQVSLISLIIDNLIQPINSNWKFDIELNNENSSLTIIKFNTHESVSPNMMKIFNKIDSNLETFILLVKKIIEIDEDRLNEIITIVLNKSIGSNNLIVNDDNDDLPLVKLINLKLLQIMVESFKDEIEKSPVVILSFIDDLLTKYFENVGKSKLIFIKNEEDIDSDDDDDDNNNSDNLDDELTSLIPIFELIGDWNPSNKDEQKRLIKLQLKIKLNTKLIPISIQSIMKRIIDINTETIPIKEKNDDLKLETILKQINDQSPSIKVFALDELTKLTITSSTNKISTKYSINLMINQLKDNEPFVYLNAIKNISKLLQFDHSQLPLILNIYQKNEKNIDERLKLAESINKFIENNGLILSSIEIDLLINTLILMVKPQTPIIDSRIRMSSLSLLGCICHNIGLGILKHIDEIIDIIKGIITFENDQPEIRRASIIIINDIVNNDHGLEILKKFGPSIETMLKYVNEFDQDLLVTQLAWDTLVEIDDAFEKKLTL